MKNYLCPICGYKGLKEDPGPVPEKWGTFEICPCCGWEFGYDNPIRIVEYRKDWLSNGAEWFCPNERPYTWSIVDQLKRIGLVYETETKL